MSSTQSQSYPCSGWLAGRRYRLRTYWILNLLSERVGPKGVVIGLEREQRFVEMARVEIAKRGMGNVTMVQVTASIPVWGKGSFDLVHERGWY